MDYRGILDIIKPDTDEINQIEKISSKLIKSINKICREENLNAEAVQVGSVAKKTFLKGKSDIDIFISFPFQKAILQIYNFLANSHHRIHIMGIDNGGDVILVGNVAQ